MARAPRPTSITSPEAPRNRFWFKVSVKGLRAALGSDIDKKLGNANKLLSASYTPLPAEKYGFNLVEIEGGNLHNAIAREAYAVVGVKRSTRRRFG